MKKNLTKAFALLATLTFVCCGGGSDDSGNTSGGDPGGNPNVLPVKTKNRSLAFPGADGGAKNITGGAGKEVYIVTTLEDTYTKGSLRYGINGGEKTIVFAVAGQINLKSQLDIKGSNMTIAGQTAPGDGITLAGYPVTISGSNVILRFLRFRMGDQNVDKGLSPDDGDALGSKNHQQILIDHCSMSYSTDECASFSRVRDFTLQYCIISESLKLAGHSKGNHGYGGIWGGINASYHHNLLAHHDSRNPRFDHQYVGHDFLGPIDYINNVVYDWGSNSTYGGETAAEEKLFHINMIGNFYKAGPSTSSSSKNRLMQLTSLCENCNKYVGKTGNTAYPAKLFIDDNKVNETGATWDNIHQDSKETRDTKAMSKLDSRWTEGLTALTFVESADKAYKTVLSYAGASKTRDAVDVRIVQDVENGTGSLIDKVSDNMENYYPTLSPGTPITDTDKDGMPDDWEIKEIEKLGVKVGIEAFTPSAYNITGQYTNLEVYMNELVMDTFPLGANASATR